MAELDFDSAKFLLNMHPKPLEIICYHCQQSAEKFLKGFIAYNGGTISKTHDLLILNKECCKYYEEFKEIQNECIDLTDYGVQLRYPFHLEINEHDVEEGLKNVNTIKEFVLKAIKNMEQSKKNDSR